MSFPRYPKYKDSGVEWLGELPVHWTTTRIKNSSYLKGRVGWKGLTSEEYLEDGYAYLVTGTDFGHKYIWWEGCHFIDQARYEDDPFIQLKNGDLLVTKDGTVGKLALVSHLDKPACLNSGIFLVRPLNDYTNEFMYWVLSSKSFRVFCDLTTLGSTIQHLYQNVFERFTFPVPPFTEQINIVAFLDRECAKIDALMEEQWRLMELLKEKRQAVISYAVTKGLNPDAPMKPSGIEWLGDVPEHWSYPKTGFHAEVTKLSGFEYTNHWRVDPGGEIVALRGFNIGAGKLNLENTETISQDLSDFLGRSKLSNGDIVLPCTGTLGAAAVIREDNRFHINQNIAKVRFDDSVNPEFAVYWFTSDLFGRIIDHNNMSGMQPVLLIRDIRRIFTPHPPTEEQLAIVSYLDSVTGEFDSLITQAQRAIDLLQERRTALISAAVTGQIDVRAHANSLAS